MNVFEKFLKVNTGLMAFNEFSTKDQSIRYINWWAINDPENVWFSSYVRSNIRTDKTINFYSVFGNANYVKRRAQRERDDVNIFFTGENVSSTGISKNFRGYKDHMGSAVDISLGFDHDQHNPRYMRFPLWLMYVFSPDSTYEDIQNRVEALNNKAVNIDERYIDCAAIARHDTTGHRTRICDALSDLFDIRYEGRWRNNSSLMKEQYKDNKLDYLAHVKFNICPENSNHAGYVTEKIFEAFLARAIPIYWGGAAVPEPNIINENAFVYWDGSDHCFETLERLHKNKKEYLDFVSQPIFKEGADEIIWQFFVDLKERIQRVIDSK